MTIYNITERKLKGYKPIMIIILGKNEKNKRNIKFYRKCNMLNCCQSTQEKELEMSFKWDIDITINNEIFCKRGNCNSNVFRRF